MDRIGIIQFVRLRVLEGFRCWSIATRIRRWLLLYRPTGLFRDLIVVYPTFEKNKFQHEKLWAMSKMGDIKNFDCKD